MKKRIIVFLFAMAIMFNTTGESVAQAADFSCIQEQTCNNSNLAKKLKKYPTATKLWIYLKSKGFNDYVCAGILGNIMTECGGQSLNLDYRAKNGNDYYGLCQWSTVYYPEICNKGLGTQINFLCNNMKYEIDTYGYLYKDNFTYAKFKKIKDERKAAMAFCKSYERCDSSSYKVRKDNATKAYKYFTK